MDSNNDLEMKRIVVRANEWCKESMTKKALAESALLALEDYVDLLFRYDPSWRDKDVSIQKSYDLAQCR